MSQYHNKFIYILAAMLISLSGTAGLTGEDSCRFKCFRPSNESSLFLFTAGYKLPLNKATIINSGHGLYIEAGINAAKFFSTKTVVAIYGGYALMDRLWSTSFNSNFINDYQNTYNPEAGLSTLDSAVASSFSRVMAEHTGKSLTAPGCEMNSFHNYSLYYGVLLKLPYRYSPVLKLYTGFTRSHLQGASGLATIKNDYNIFQLRRSMVGAELILFRGFQSTFSKSNKSVNHLNSGALSIYYEANNLSNASLYFDDGKQQTSIALKKVSSASFLSKYKAENYWGLKLSFFIL
ncbi:MAG: hypothetical protein JWO32_2372 [Bacteroidetes bacterium]|nr:hypothetical protein [Bacteroidota bacterium]